MPTPQSPHTALLAGVLTAVTLAVCGWIAVTVSFGAAAISVIGVVAALWLYVAATRPLTTSREPIPVRVPRRRPSVRSKP